MTTSLYLQCIAMYLGGQAIELFLIKIPGFKKLYTKANEEFVWSKYWASDWNVILGTAVLGFMLIIGLDQIVHWKPVILEYVKWFFAAAGGFGSSVIASKWSSSKKYIENIIDTKTNIADDKTKP